MTIKLRLAAILCAFTSFVSAQTTLPTSWNFTTPGITNPPNGWTTGLGTNGNLTYSFGVGDVLACRFDATGEFLLINFADKPGPLSYYLSPQNAGAAWGGQFDVQESADGNSWTTLRSITTKATTATNFTGGKYTDNLKLTSRFVRFYYTSKLPGGQPAPGGNMALDSVLILPAPAGVTANLNLKTGSTTIVNNSLYIVGNTASTSFTIENKGTVDTLLINSSAVTGSEGGDYSLNGMPTKVAPNSSANFTLNFTAGANGSRKAQLNIGSSDPDKPVFKVDLYGIGGQFATEPATASNNLQYRNLKSYTLDLTFDTAGVKTENYLVLRKNTSAVTEQPTDGQTYTRGDYIGGAQVLYNGPGGNWITPLFIVANSTYQFAVFPYNGPKGFENYRTTSPVKGSVTTTGSAIGSYYSTLDAGASDFLIKLSQKINPHDTIYYSNYISTMTNRFAARDTTGGKKVVTCVYTGLNFVYDEPFVWWNGSNTGVLTREHTYAQSWMPTDAQLPGNPELPEYNDLHNLFPADQANANGKRSNFPFGEIVGAPTFTSPTGKGKLGKNAANQTVWEPRDEQKGDLARALFYMATCYNGIGGNNWKLPATQDLAVLKKWHFQDLPDKWEIARNEFVYDLQGNRNPFIDSVNYACRIDFTNMSWIASPSNCGINILMPASITMTYPLGGEALCLNLSNQITWNSSGVDTVKIDYTPNGTTFYPIVSKVQASAGTYYRVGGTFPSSNNGYFRISSIADTNVKAMNGTSFRIDICGGVDNVQSTNQVQVYPNPSTGHFAVKRNLTGSPMVCRLYDITGALLQEQTLAVSESETSFAPSNKGVFILLVSEGNMLWRHRVIVQ